MITLQVNDTVLKKRLAELQRRSADASPAFAAIAEVLRASVEQNFLDEGRYSAPGDWRGGSTKWQQLAPATVAKRAKSGRGAHPILQVSGQLAASISTASGPRSAEVGTNLFYAAIHQFGGQAGRGHKVKIPPRPFLVVQDEDLDDAMDIIAQHLLKGEK